MRIGSLRLRYTVTSRCLSRVAEFSPTNRPPPRRDTESQVCEVKIAQTSFHSSHIPRPSTSTLDESVASGQRPRSTSEPSFFQSNTHSPQSQANTYGRPSSHTACRKPCCKRHSGPCGYLPRSSRYFCTTLSIVAEVELTL